MKIKQRIGVSRTFERAGARYYCYIINSTVIAMITVAVCNYLLVNSNMPRFSLLAASKQSSGGKFE